MILYRSLEPIDREDGVAQLESPDSTAVVDAILRLSLHDPDGSWVTTRAVSLLSSRDSAVRGAAATALGHVARIHRSIDTDLVVPALRNLLGDNEIVGRVEDALDDIAVFATPSDSDSQP
ncbi:hypothetical protein [Nocardia sp. NPDC058666]|uniref:hypothetical protein n=1 Tax=Nocardia sp. NPDC058666 TaxID=3346587 RepID=UPI0036518E35